MKKIVVYGIGGIGGYVGERIAAGAEAMARAGAGIGKPELAFVARGAHLAAIRKEGLRYRAPDGKETTVRPAVATDDPGVLGQVDLVFLCVKGYDLAAACSSLKGAVGPATTVVPLLNGADVRERVRAVLGKGYVLPAAIYISSSVAEPGLVVHAGGKGNLVLGREPAKLDFDPAPLRTLLDHSAIPYEWFDDPLPAIWTKFLFIASFALATGLSGKTIGEVLADDKLAASVRAIQREIAAIAKAKGIALPADAADAAFEKGKAFPPSTKTSYQRDLEVPGKPNEGDLFGGTILRLGRELGVPTPATADVFGRIEARGRAL